jgi:hypothetical protein
MRFLLALLAGTLAAQPITFRANLIYSATLGSNWTVATGDFNGDGRPDVILAGLEALLLYPGRGDGTLAPPVNLNVSFMPFAAAAGDFNGDGYTDLAVTVYYPDGNAGTLEIMLGKGNGTFAPPMPVALPSPELSYPLVADFNGDGIPDILVWGSTGAVVAVGNGDGTFQTPVAVSNLDSVSGLALGDFNGDGYIDIATIPVFTEGSNILLQFGNGKGAFPKSEKISVGLNNIGYLSGIASGYFNADHRLDLVVGGSEGYAILLGTGGGHFSSPRSYLDAAGSVFVADINGDGVSDLIFTDSADNVGLGYALGNGDASFQPATFTYQLVTSLALADFNGDGITDVVGLMDPNLEASAMTVILGSQAGLLTAPVLPNIPSWGLVSGDFNGDGHPDLAASGFQWIFGPGDSGACDEIHILLGNGRGGFTPSQTFGCYTVGGVGGMVVGDFTGDGVPDLATTPNAADHIAIYPGMGDGTFGAPFTLELSHDLGAMAAGDFNRDGKLDLAVVSIGARPARQGSLFILLGNGDGTFQPAKSYAAGQVPSAIAEGDLNGDGITDLVVANYESRNLSVFYGKPDGTFQPALTISDGYPPSAVQIADLNGDGLGDIVVVDGYVSVFLNRGGGGFELSRFSPCIGYLECELSGLSVADYNGDGIPDVAVPLDEARAVAVLQGKGDGSFGPPVLYGTQQDSGAVLPGRFFGSSLPDLAVATGGSISLLQNTSPQ